MNIIEAQVNRELVVAKNNITDDTIRFRLLDIGLYSGARVKVVDKKRGNRNILVVFNSVKYMLDTKVAKSIEVEYA